MYQLLEKAAANSDILDAGGFSGWYHNYLARNTGDLEETGGVPPVSDNKETGKNRDSDDDSEEDESEIITLSDDPVDKVDSTSQDVDNDMIMTDQTAPAGDGSDLDSFEESADSEPENNLHAIFRSVAGEGGFKRQVVVAHVLQR